jgi:hypothetical protein
MALREEEPTATQQQAPPIRTCLGSISRSRDNPERSYPYTASKVHLLRVKQGKAVAWLKTGLQFLKLKHSLIPICSIFSASCLYFQNQICKLKTSVSFHMSLASPTESAASASSQIGGLSLDSCWLDRSSMPHSLLSLDFSSSELVQAA